jgi:hypothetical protein
MHPSGVTRICMNLAVASQWRPLRFFPDISWDS